MILALVAALALCAVIAWIWRHEARKPCDAGVDYPHENLRGDPDRQWRGPEWGDGS